MIANGAFLKVLSTSSMKPCCPVYCYSFTKFLFDHNSVASCVTYDIHHFIPHNAFFYGQYCLAETNVTNVGDGVNSFSFASFSWFFTLLHSVMSVRSFTVSVRAGSISPELTFFISFSSVPLLSEAALQVPVLVGLLQQPFFFIIYRFD